MLKCHTEPNELYAQVGDPDLDHAFWGPPECMNMPRPCLKIDEKNPGKKIDGV